MQMLLPGCAIPNLAKICLLKFKKANIYPSTEENEDLLEKNLEDVVGGSGGSVVFTRRATFDEFFYSKLNQYFQFFLLGLTPVNYTPTPYVNL